MGRRREVDRINWINRVVINRNKRSLGIVSVVHFSRETNGSVGSNYLGVFLLSFVFRARREKFRPLGEFPLYADQPEEGHIELV